MRHWHLLRLAALLAGATGPALAQNVGIGTTASTQTLDVAGTVRATAFAHTSDARLKQQVRLLAQEVKQVYPELVSTGPDRLQGCELRPTRTRAHRSPQGA